MKLQHLRAITAPWLLPVVTAALAAAIFVADTIADLEIAFPAFYTVVVLMSVRFCKRRGVILVGAGCIGLTLLSDLLTAATRLERDRRRQYDDQHPGDRHHDLSLAQDRIGKSGGLRGALAARACRPRDDAGRTDRVDRARGQSAARRGGDQRQCLRALARGRSAQSRRGAAGGRASGQRRQPGERNHRAGARAHQELAAAEGLAGDQRHYSGHASA